MFKAHLTALAMVGDRRRLIGFLLFMEVGCWGSEEASHK